MNPLAIAIEAINAEVTPGAGLIGSKCRGLMRGYHARWKDSPLEVATVEEFLTANLYNPESKRASRSFTIAGKLDATVRDGGRLMILDHKTTSDEIADPAGTYWRQLAIEGQISHYQLLMWLNGRKVDGAIWDVIRKPTISPKLLSKKDVEMVTMSKSYLGEPISGLIVASLQATMRETMSMYETRLAQDCTTERPNWYFQRRTVPRLDSEILDYAQELWNHGQDMLHANANNRFPRNSGACMQYGSPCRFLGICSGYDTPDSDNWTRKEQVHSELETLQGDGRHVLTNSRIRTFQTCRRREYYAYQLGIERQNEEEKESLYFGSLLHKALEAYFKTLVVSEAAEVVFA